MLSFSSVPDFHLNDSPPAVRSLRGTVLLPGAQVSRDGRLRLHLPRSHAHAPASHLGHLPTASAGAGADATGARWTLATSPAPALAVDALTAPARWPRRPPSVVRPRAPPPELQALHAQTRRAGPPGQRGREWRSRRAWRSLLFWALAPLQ